MKEFKVRNKNPGGKPISGWRTVYANTEREAVLKDAVQRDMQKIPFKYPQIKLPKWRF